MSENWYICEADTKVLYFWWYDTIAILPEYDDIEEGILPKGELVKISEDEYTGELVLLDLKNHKKLKKSQLPKGRVQESLLLCKATPLQALVTKDEFQKNFSPQVEK